MHTLRGLVVLLSCALVSLPPLRANAQSTYDSLVQEAIAREAAGEHEMAHLLFQNAHQLTPNARTLRGMGVASFGAGQYVRALGELTAALYHLEKPLDQRLEAATRELIRRAREHVALLQLQVTPASARVLIDDQQPASDHLDDIPLSAGRHMIAVAADGFEPQSHTVDVQIATSTTLIITLRPKVLPAASKPVVSTRVQPVRPVTARPPVSRNVRIALASSLTLAVASGATAGILWWRGNRRIDDLVSECASTAIGRCDSDAGARALSDLELQRWQRSTNAMIALSAVSAATALSVTIWQLSKGRSSRKLALVPLGMGAALRGQL